jgi:hypothetical protein
MIKKDALENKIREISEIIGERTIFRIGVDHSTGEMMLLSVDCLGPNKKGNPSKQEIPNYIG